MCDILFEINAFCEINTNYDTCTLTLMYTDLSTCIQTFFSAKHDIALLLTNGLNRSSNALSE